MRKQLFALFILILTATTPALAQTSAVEDSWNSKTPLQVARGGLGVAVVDEKILLLAALQELGLLAPPYLLLR